MNERKSYTAQDMREAADFFMRNSESVRQKVRSNSVLANIHESIAMLRQAAEMRERAEEVRARHSIYYGKIDYENETAIVDEVDYILRGAEGKE